MIHIPKKQLNDDREDEMEDSQKERNSEEESGINEETEEKTKGSDKIEKKKKEKPGEIETEEEIDNNEKTAEEEIKIFEEDVETQKKEKDERQEREKKELKKLSEDEEQAEKRLIAGQKIVGRHKIFSRKLKVFRHNKLKSFNTTGVKRMEKVLKKVHGVPLKKKLEFIRALQAYNPSKTTLRRNDLEKFSRAVKHKKFTGPNAKRMAKEINPKELRFKKREVDKITRALVGKEDPYKYKRKSSAGTSGQKAQSKITR